MTHARHPTSGTAHVHVVPPDWGPYVDVHACLSSLARRRPWVHVISPAEYDARRDGPLWTDPSVLFVDWRLVHDPGPKERRRCMVACVYSEAMDEDGANLLPAHLAAWDAYRDAARHFDGVFAHTPWMSGMVGRADAPAFVMPLGWDAEAMGRPRWNAPKHVPLLYHGSDAGRRGVVLPIFARILGSGLVNASGSYGRALLGALDTATASLYVAHSPVRSFSTWRLWQTASTSAAMIAEPGDSWPFEPDVHYAAIPRITLENVESVARAVGDLSRETDLVTRLASAAHAAAAEWTVDRIDDECVAAAAASMRADREGIHGG